MTIVDALLLWLGKSGNYLSLFVLKQMIAEHLSKVGKNYLPKKRGRPPSTGSTPISSRGGTRTEVVTGTPPKKNDQCWSFSLMEILIFYFLFKCKIYVFVFEQRQQLFCRFSFLNKD